MIEKKIKWDSVWAALAACGISAHLVWALQCLYAGQTGLVCGSNYTESSEFNINAGVRQGCILSPRLFSAALQFHMSAWRQQVNHVGINLEDGYQSLLDLRLADDVLLFATSSCDICTLLDALVDHLGQAGLKLNLDKTVVLTNTAQAPDHVTTPGGLKLKILDRSESHKWLGCLLCTNPLERFHQDIDHHIQAASRSFFANRALLCDKNVPIAARLRYFDAVVSSAACWASCHRTYQRMQSQIMSVAFCKLVRRVVGPPAALDWSRPWHEILHEWNARATRHVTSAHIRSWSETCLRSYWRMASHIARLPDDRWVKRALLWQPKCTGRRGRPRYSWDSMLISFCRSRQLPDWLAAAASDEWPNLEHEFVVFCSHGD